MSDVANVDSVIYRFYPYGSKNIDDLTFFSDLANASWTELNTLPTIWFWDQEPIDRNLYGKEIIADKKLPWPDSLGNDLKEEFKDDFWDRMDVRFYLSWNIVNIYDKIILIHSEKNSDDVAYYSNHGFIPVYYWSHAIIARDWYRYAEYDTSLDVKLPNINIDFLVYNRAWSGTREYRLKFSEMIVQNDLVDNCNMKFRANDNGVHYTQHVFKNPAFQITATNLEDIFPENTTEASVSAEIDFIDYYRCGIEVVLETLFDTTKNQLTEKSLRPIAAGRPFMLVGAPGSLQYLRDYGFKTFDGLIDESYDTIQDPVARLEAVIAEMKRISALSAEEKQTLYTQIYAIAEENKALFFSDAWGSSIVSEFKTNFDAGMVEMEQNKKGTHIKYLVDTWFARYPEFEAEFHSKPHRSREEFDAVLAMVR